MTRGREFLASFGLFMLPLLWFARSARAESHSALQLAVGSRTGTISLVGDGADKWIVTAYHNFAEHNSSDAEVLANAKVIRNASTPSVPLGSLVESTPLCVLPDLGVLAARVSHNGATKLAGMNAVFALWKAPSVGDVVVAFGNPAVTILGKKSDPFDEAASGTISTLLVAGAQLPPEALAGGAPNTLLAIINGLAITHGFSGGPVFPQGQIDKSFLGMVQGGDNGTTSWAVPSDVIHAKLSDPKNCKPMGTTDGFTDYHYARTPGALFNVSEVAPNPLEPRANEDVEVQIVVQAPGDVASLGNGRLHFVPDRASVPGLTHVAGVQEVTIQNGEATFSVVLRFDDRAASEATAVPFVVHLGDREVARFEIPVEHSAMRLRAGLVSYAVVPVSGLRPSRDVQPFDVAALVDFGVDVRVSRTTTVAFMAGAGPSIGYENHRALDPRGAVVLGEHAAELEWGPRFQVEAELRLYDDRVFGMRAALGGGWERHPFDSPPSADPSVNHHQFEAIVEVGPTLRVDPLQLFGSLVAEYRAPSTADTQYVSLTTQQAVPRNGEWAFGLSLGAAHDF